MKKSEFKKIIKECIDECFKEGFYLDDNTPKIENRVRIIFDLERRPYYDNLAKKIKILKGEEGFIRNILPGSDLGKLGIARHTQKGNLGRFSPITKNEYGASYIIKLDRNITIFLNRDEFEVIK